MYKRYTAEHIKLVLDKELEKAHKEKEPMSIDNTKNKCAVDGCSRGVFAKGFCNTHYIRSRKGKDLSYPIKPRDKNSICNVCGDKRGEKGGLGLCSKHYKQFKYELTKDAAIKALGGFCQKCGGTFHRSVFDFHHIEGKDGNPSYLITNSSFEKIAQELSKCVLLCANCHRIEHSSRE